MSELIGWLRYLRQKWKTRGRCPMCGKRVYLDDSYCPRCGYEFKGGVDAKEHVD